MVYSLSWKQDVPDARDHDATPRLTALRAAAASPPAARNADLVKILDQGRLGACTSHGAGQAVRAAALLEMVEAALALWTKAGNDPTKFDSAAALVKAQSELEFWARLMMYWLGRAYDGETAIDSGTQIRNVFQAANEYGYAPESAWTYDDDPSKGAKFSKMPPSDVFRLAFDQRDDKANEDANFIDYERITSTGAQRVIDIKTAVAARHFVVFGTQVTNAFCQDSTANGGNPIGVPANGTPIAGGHALCVGGYDANGADIVNSWGLNYGGGGPTSLPKGWFRFGWDYMEWSQTTDLWIVRRAPLFLGASR